MRTDIDKPVELLNSQLPPVIRVVGIKKTTKMFDAKNNCSYRTYEYLTPTYAFAPIEDVCYVELSFAEVIGHFIQYILMTMSYRNHM